MSRLTLCFSRYSLMSRRIRLPWPGQSCSARAFARLVLPTPLGPQNKKLPRGRSPPGKAHLRTMARATCSTASRWPNTCRDSASSSPSIRSPPWRRPSQAPPRRMRATRCTCSSVTRSAPSMAAQAAASSIRSTDRSGSARPMTHRGESSAAAVRAPSVMVTP